MTFASENVERFGRLGVLDHVLQSPWPRKKLKKSLWIFSSILFYFFLWVISMSMSKKLTRKCGQTWRIFPCPIISLIGNYISHYSKEHSVLQCQYHHEIILIGPLNLLKAQTLSHGCYRKENQALINLIINNKRCHDPPFATPKLLYIGFHQTVANHFYFFYISFKRLRYIYIYIDW